MVTSGNASMMANGTNILPTTQSTIWSAAVRNADVGQKMKNGALLDAFPVVDEMLLVDMLPLDEINPKHIRVFWAPVDPKSVCEWKVQLNKEKKWKEKNFFFFFS